MTRLRVFTLLLAALLSTVLAVPWAPAAWGDNDDEGRSGDNAAEAINEKDGKSVFDLAFDVREVSNGVVDQTNSAVAYANCENCQTVAIAVQIILVTGSPDTVTPENYAVAVNEECTACQTLALAYQFVLGGGEPLEFTREGRRQLKRIQREFKKLGKSDLSVDEIRAEANKLAAQLGAVLNDPELLVRRDDDDGDEDDDRGDDRRSLDDEEETGTAPEEPQQDETAPQDPAEPQDPAPEPLPPETEQQPPPTTTEPEPAPAPEDGATTPESP